MSTTGNGEPAQQPICGDQSIARGLLDRQRKAWGRRRQPRTRAAADRKHALITGIWR